MIESYGLTPGDMDRVVNLDKLQKAWSDYISLADLVVFQSAAHWPSLKQQQYDRRVYVDKDWKLIHPSPSTYDAYR